MDRAAVPRFRWVLVLPDDRLGSDRGRATDAPTHGDRRLGDEAWDARKGVPLGCSSSGVDADGRW